PHSSVEKNIKMLTQLATHLSAACRYWLTLLLPLMFAELLAVEDSPMSARAELLDRKETPFKRAQVQWGISEQESEGMFELLRRERPSVTAEIGCANGASTLVIAGALERNGSGRH